MKLERLQSHVYDVKALIEGAGSSNMKHGQDARISSNRLDIALPPNPLAPSPISPVFHGKLMINAAGFTTPA